MIIRPVIGGVIRPPVHSALSKGGWAFFTTTFMRDATVMRDSARMIDHG